MCIQRHPCKYKCYQNYMTLFKEFPNNSSNNNFDNNCWCNKPEPKPNCGCFKNLFPISNKNKYSFCLQGTIKFDGFC